MLDMQTIIAGHVLSTVIMVIVLMLLWYQNRNRVRGPGYWVLGYLLHLAGLMLILLRGVLPPFLSISIGNILIVSTLFAFYYGLALFVSKEPEITVHSIFLVIFMMAYSWYSLVEPILYIRYVLLATGICWYILFSILLLLRNVDSTDRHIYIPLIVVLALLFLLYLFRGSYGIIIKPGGDFFNNTRFIDGVMLLLNQMLSVLLTFSLATMINGHLIIELQGYIAKNEKMLTQVRHLASTDGLTQLYNRMKLEDMLTAEVLRSKRHNRTLSVLVIDIDHFKEVNDNHGHQVGDMVLQQIAATIADAIRGSDTAGRWGGEEFIVLTPETDLDGAAELAEKIRERVADVVFSRIGVKTISIGVATLQEHEWEEDMIRRADEALYRAKESGRNRVERATV